MYQILSALGLLDNLDGKFHPVDIGNMAMKDIYSKYVKVYVNLTHTIVGGKFTLNMDKLPPEIKIQSYTFSQYLVSNGDAALPVEPESLTLDYKTVASYNLWNCGFSFEPMNRDYHPETFLTEGMKLDLYGTKEEANKENLIKYCLFTVNGFVHLADTVAEGICIFNGYETGKKGDDTQIGLIDFQHIAPLTCYPLKEDMIFKRKDTVPFKEYLYIRSPVDMTNKTPFLVVGGYLHALDGLYKAVSPNVLRFDFFRYSWLKRFNLAQSEINLDSLGIEFLNNGAINADSMFSDEVIKNWFTLPQSFLVLIDKKELNVSTMEVEYSGLPGVYYSYSKPTYPLILGDGKIAEYSRSDQRFGWVLRTAKYIQDNMAFELTTRDGWGGVPMQRISTEPVKPANARFLIISATVEVPDVT